MHIHFMGIGGTAMGSVAVAASQIGHRVTGSDHAVYEPMRGVLDRHGIVWTEYADGSDLVVSAPDLVIVGNAISRGHPELEAVLDARIPIASVSEFVGQHFIARNTGIVCSGTHGKTTTASLTTWILQHAGFEPGFLVGGVPHGFTNGCRPVPPATHNTCTGVFVAEGDEYDTAFFDKRSKFVHYRPNVAIINNIEFDHADIFDSLDSIKKSFVQLTRLVPRSGLILVNADDADALNVTQHVFCPVQSVGKAPSATWQITNIVANPDGSQWYLRSESAVLGPFALSMAGEHNIRNASMALLAAMHVGVTGEECILALEHFVPPKRRMEKICVWKGAMVIDDFAHHPTAIRATLQAVQQQFPTAAIHAIFEPRSNTTTRNIFQDELAECFTGAATVVIGPVHRPERFQPSERLNTNQLISDLAARGINGYALTEATDSWGSSVIPWLETHVTTGDVVLLLSNGNVGGLRSILASA